MTYRLKNEDCRKGTCDHRLPGGQSCAVVKYSSPTNKHLEEIKRLRGLLPKCATLECRDSADLDGRTKCKKHGRTYQ